MSGQQTQNNQLDIYLQNYLDQDTISKEAFSKPIKLLSKIDGVVILEFSLIADRVGHGVDNILRIKSDTLFAPYLANGGFDYISIEGIRAKNKYNQIITLNRKSLYIRP